MLCYNVMNMIIYEQPLNEIIRLCLRVEYLFRQVKHHLEVDTEWDSRVALGALLEILSVIDRPDLKSKLGQMLNQYVATFVQLEKVEKVDHKILKVTLDRLHKAINIVHSNQSRIGQELRENEFLLSILQKHFTPAGTCPFNAPAYHLWLQQPANLRLKTLSLWLETLFPLYRIVELILQLTRDSASSEKHIAHGGFYQTNLDPTIFYQMISIEISEKERLYPEISVGRYRLTVHFFELSTKDRAHQTAHDVSFGLKCCKI